MSISNRRRGAQPGNQNALKHGLYRGKPDGGQRGWSSQLDELNRLLHDPDASPPATAEVGTGPVLPPSARLIPERRTPAPPTAALTAVLTLVERQLLDLLEEPACQPSELATSLRRLNDLLYQLLYALQATPTPNLSSSERNKLP